MIMTHCLETRTGRGFSGNILWKSSAYADSKPMIRSVFLCVSVSL